MLTSGCEGSVLAMPLTSYECPLGFTPMLPRLLPQGWCRVISFQIQHSEVDLTGVLRDGVPAEITSLSKTVWLVAEALLSAALLLVDDDLTLVTGDWVTRMD